MRITFGECLIVICSTARVLSHFFALVAAADTAQGELRPDQGLMPRLPLAAGNDRRHVFIVRERNRDASRLPYGRRMQIILQSTLVADERSTVLAPINQFRST